VKGKAPPPKKGFFVNRSNHLVQIDGQHISGLTELEFEFVCYLYENRGHLCTKDDIVRNVYRQQYNFRENGLTDQMLHALMSRLRRKIEPDSTHPKYVVTVRGEGYKFIAPGEDE
jgi:DNA-binding response OmpR family regulator